MCYIGCMEGYKVMRKRAFTLIELLIVLLILGVLTGIAVPRYMESTKTAKRVTFETNLQDIVKALEDYKIQHQFENTLYPTSLEQLMDSKTFNKEPINPYTGKSMLSSNSDESGLQYQATGGEYKLCVVQRDIEDVNDNGIVDEILPLVTKTTCIGNTTSNIGVEFKRNSVAYTSNGAQVAVNQPRFEPGKFGKAIMMEEGTTNLLPANKANCEKAPDVTAYATVTVDTSRKLVGSGSLKVQWDGSGPYAYAQYNITLTNGNTYTVSGWVYAEESKYLRLSVQETAKPWRMFRTASFLIPAKQWTRLSITFTLPSDWTQPSKIQLYTPWNSTTSSDLATIPAWWDAIQVEQKPYATSFIDGTRAVEDLTIPTAGGLNDRGPWTIECWGKTNNAGNNWRMPFSVWSKFYVALRYNKPVFSWADANNTQKWKYASNPINNVTDWHYWVLTWDGTIARVYVDAIKVIEVATDLPNPLPGPWTLDIGRVKNNNNYWDGLIDDLRISSRARTDEEIAAAYASGQPLPVDAWTTLKLDFNGEYTERCICIP